jgi:hypothetical protein
MHPVGSVSELIAFTRDLAIGDTVALALTAPPATAGYARDDDGATYRWYVERAGIADHIDAVASELRSQLIVAGSTCSEPRRMRAFARFDEVRR